jgi:hypothetical protein
MVAALQDAGKDVTREPDEGDRRWNNKQASAMLPPLSFSTKRHIGMNSMGLAGVENGQLKR